MPPTDSGPFPAPAREGLAALVEASVELRGELARLEARRLVSVHEAVEFAVRRADAFVSPRIGASGRRELARRAVIAELAVAWRVSEYTMQRLAAQAYTLCTQLPVTLAAMREGALDAAHGRVIAEAVAGVDADPGVLEAADAELAALARTMTPAKLRRVAKRVLERLQVVTLAERHARAFAERAVEIDAAPDGMAWLAVHLRAGDALLIRDRLQQAVTAAKTDVTESRTGAQLEADLARDLLLYGVPADGAAHADDALPSGHARPSGHGRQPGHARPSGRARQSGHGRQPGVSGPSGVAVPASIRPTVHVTVPVLTLLGLEEAPADLDGYGPIDADTARALASHAASFTRLLTDPITGAVLDVDRTSYRVPSDLRRWVQVRDGTCRFPGCTRVAVRCEVDHSEAWAADHGTTAHDNLAHLCAAHHHLKHETAWSVRHLDDGVLEWTSLTGAVYRTTPEGDLRAGPPVRRTGSPDPADRSEGSEAETCSEGPKVSRRRPPATYPSAVNF